VLQINFSCAMIETELRPMQQRIENF